MTGLLAVKSHSRQNAFFQSFFFENDHDPVWGCSTKFLWLNLNISSKNRAKMKKYFEWNVFQEFEPIKPRALKKYLFAAI